MSDEPTRNRSDRFSRRAFMKASGAVAGAGLVGSAATGSAAAEEGSVGVAFANHRVQRAAHAWERGYRGRPDRTVALTDTGADARHPDVGPWNGLTVSTADGFEMWTFEGDPPETAGLDGETFEFVAPSSPLVATNPLTPHEDTERITLELDRVVDNGTVGVEVELHEDGTTVLALRDEVDRTAAYDFADPAEHDYELVVDAETAPNGFEVRIGYHEFTANAPSRVDADDADPFGPVDDTPMLVGWHNDHTRYGSFRAPRDDNSHGTHVSSIMTGSGRASAIDQDRSRVDEPRAVLVPGEVLSYEVSARADTGVFGAAYGQGIEIVIEGPDGRQLRRSRGASGTSEESMLNNTAETPTVHGSGEATYTVYVRATEGEALPARVERVAAGAFHHHGETAGGALSPAEGGDIPLHAGVCPANSLLALTNLAPPLRDMGEHAAQFVSTFNLRALNMSWGWPAGIPFGTVAGVGDAGELEALRNITDEGVLPVVSAGNDGQPASGNDIPAGANESISVVATGPLDGIASYSSGGVGAVDEETNEPYGKPDVTAIGGIVEDLDQAAMPGPVEAPADDDPRLDDEQFGRARTYSGKGGTSMAAPSVTGLAGLVAQAMEEDAPEAIAMPEPAAAGREDVSRLKSTILATASTTAFTAAPYHRGKAPSYTHAGRDPYEGYGRVNAGAAVDAVTRDLLPAATEIGPDETTSATVSDAVGLDVPHDEGAVAGYVRGEGTYDVSLEFTHYSGGNAGMTKGDPHLDLLVYDAENPDELTGEPTVVASDRGFGGDASVSFDADGGVYSVVVELVNVPGVVNGFDVRANVDLEVAFESAPLPAFDATGSRDGDGSVFTGGQTNRMVVTVEDVTELEGATLEVTDRAPEGWTVFADGDVVSVDDDNTVHFPDVDTAELAGDDAVSFVYYAQAPEGPAETGDYTFGPARVELVGDPDDHGVRNGADDFAGTETVAVVGQSTSV